MNNLTTAHGRTHWQAHCYEWTAYLDLLNKLDTSGLIDNVRSIEAADRDGNGTRERSGATTLWSSPSFRFDSYQTLWAAALL